MANPSNPKAKEEPAEEHYEVVSEYRIGEGPPPPFLVVAFVLIFMYAAVSWIPFFNY
ncbi:hypothetical protein KF707_19335 [Candidatus Obscuribacterales bacterium]|jgi:hypothetical protein|nr:hypothetical protein [Candidatus Obscuribacterales bacterium]MBX3138391.1 hypothetical protein [Candidatus Obscuribacterales bacterium]MBX3153651.1 hypothetical protein [Candidatus Obscuribacterales bacterium]